MLSSSMMHAIKLIENVFVSTSIVASWVSIYYQKFSTSSHSSRISRIMWSPSSSLGDHIMKHVCMMY